MNDQPTESHETPVAAPPRAPEESYAPVQEGDGWFDEPETLPPRPRRRLLTPLPVALLCVLLTACGFIGGVLVEKGQEGSGGSATTGGSGLAARFAALRAAGGASSTSRSAGTGTAGTTGAGAGFPGAAGGSTIGQVAFVEGSTLYVTETTSGNTVKVKTSAASTVTKTVKGTVHAIHPGEQVVVSGPTAANGTVTAESIRVGSTGSGGLGALFGGAGSTGSTSTTSTTTSSSTSGPALFGNG
jgi:hypothetical protein